MQFSIGSLLVATALVGATLGLWRVYLLFLSSANDVAALAYVMAVISAVAIAGVTAIVER
jgi:hypothetical protein